MCPFNDSLVTAPTFMPTVWGAVFYFHLTASPTIFLLAMMSRHHFAMVTSLSCSLAEDLFVAFTSSSPSLTLNSLCEDSSFLSLASTLSNGAGFHAAV